MGIFKGNERLELLGYDLICMVSIGKVEKLDVIIQKIQEGEVVHYLWEKYGDEELFRTKLAPESVYNIDEWEKVICDNFSYISRGHDVEDKMGLCNDNDGLLLLIEIILEIKANDYQGNS